MGVGHVTDEEEEEESESESEPEEQRKKGKPKNLLCHLKSPGVPGPFSHHCEGEG